MPVDNAIVCGLFAMNAEEIEIGFTANKKSVPKLLRTPFRI